MNVERCTVASCTHVVHFIYFMCNSNQYVGKGLHFGISFADQKNKLLHGKYRVILYTNESMYYFLFAILKGGWKWIFVIVSLRLSPISHQATIWTHSGSQFRT